MKWIFLFLIYKLIVLHTKVQKYNYNCAELLQVNITRTSQVHHWMKNKRFVFIFKGSLYSLPKYLFGFVWKFGFVI